MTALKSAGTVAAGMLATLTVAAFGQSGAARDAAPRPATATIVLDSEGQLGRLDWIEKSEVAALSEGVIEKMELREGDPAVKDQPIGYLHKEIAELTVSKNALLAGNTASIEKGQAARDVAVSVVARNKRLNDQRPGMVSQEDVAKAEGELKVAQAQVKEAMEQVAINKAELALAKQMLKQHTIVAPFNGIVIKRMKDPGESVRANEAVVEIGNLSRLWAEFHVPLEYALRVKEGQIVEIQPRLVGTRGDQPIERQTFRGKITFVDPEIQPIAETAVLIRAEFENPNFDLRPGFKVAATIFLNDDVASRIPQPSSR